MDMKKPLFSRVKWLKFEHVVYVKFTLTIGLLAAYVVPHPYNILVSSMSNMIWLWKVK